MQTYTSTWIKITTAAGIILCTGYLGNYDIAVIPVALFAPLIGFYFAAS